MSAVDVPPEDTDDLLAAELVLGVLDSTQRRNLQARADSDRVFAERVAYWERLLAPWLSDIQPIEPPARVWSRIGQRLGWQDSEQASASLRGSLVFWRTAAALAALVAVVAIGALFQQPEQTGARAPTAGQPAGQAVTTLWHDDGTPGWLVSVDPTRGSVLAVPVPAPTNAQGRVPELWVISAGQAPRSLGLVSGDRPWTVAVPANVRAALVSGSILAVSLESAAGAPHAAPAGPIVAKGSI